MPISKSSKIMIILVAGLLMFIGWATAVPAAYGQGGNWTEPVILSSRQSSAWFPDIATDLAGGVHVFWGSSRSMPNRAYGYDTVIYCPLTPTGCTQTVEIAGSSQSGGTYATRPVAVADQNGYIQLLWHGPDIIYYMSAPVEQAFSAHSWSSTRRTSGNKLAYYTDIAEDQQGILHILWNEGVIREDAEYCFNCADIFYRRSEDGGQSWSTPELLSNTELESKKPHLSFGTDGSVYVAWQENAPPTTGGASTSSSMIISSTDGGLTWGEPTTFSFPGDSPQSIVVGVDGQNKVVVVWQQVKGDGIFFQVSRDHGHTWSPPRQIPGLSTRSVYNDLDAYDVAVDSAGHLHLVLVARITAQVEEQRLDPTVLVPDIVFHLEWNGSRWSEPTPIFSSPGNLPEWPRIAVGNGNQLYVVWYVRDRVHIWDSDNGEYTVWYARGESSAMAIVPVSFTRPTPTPELTVTTPTPDTSLTLQPTPIPLVASNEKVFFIETSDSIYTEVDDVTLLLLSLLPITAVIITIAVVSRIRR